MSQCKLRICRSVGDDIQSSIAKVPCLLLFGYCCREHWIIHKHPLGKKNGRDNVHSLVVVVLFLPQMNFSGFCLLLITILPSCAMAAAHCSDLTFLLCTASDFNPCQNFVGQCVCSTRNESIGLQCVKCKYELCLYSMLCPAKSLDCVEQFLPSPSFPSNVSVPSCKTVRIIRNHAVRPNQKIEDKVIRLLLLQKSLVLPVLTHFFLCAVKTVDLFCTLSA